MGFKNFKWEVKVLILDSVKKTIERLYTPYTCL